MTAASFVTAYGFRAQGRLNRREGGLPLCAFIAYNTWLAKLLLATIG